MFDKLLASEAVSEAVEILCNDMPFALWETAYVTVLSTLFAVIIWESCWSSAKRAEYCRCLNG